ncbi:PBP1A family penicillin-binding protein [Bacillus daqingensis]|uniref:PBP1A family penicillin-binding protein n=1 Tax=Bacillus daqingensis TaxID=872396 RepID=A0ABV9NUW5_9BACI
MAENLSRSQRKKSRGPEKPKKKTSGRGFFKKVFMVFLILIMVGIIAGGITAFAIIRDAPELDHEQLTLSQNPEILDMNDEIITTLETGENRRSADIEEVPPVMIDAVLAIEDARFYDHFGIDVRRLGGAVVANVRSGFGSEGASTITQQVVKNLFFDFDKTITRKLQEQYLALQLEQSYTKDQILEMYLNAIYFSDGRYGIVEASSYYFNKELDELELEDAALLAGIPQRPNAHNPYNNPDLAENRRNIVLDRMAHYGKITEEEAAEAKSIPVEEQLERTEREPNQFQSYIDQVLDEVEEIEGIEASDIYTGGLKIYTNLDRDLQEHVERVMQTDEFVQFPDELMQAGVTLMDTDTGQVHAIGGMREQAEGVRMWNWATSPSRQAGSTSKPIFAYGPVIEHEQWSTGQIIEDEEYEYTTGDPVRNFTRTFRGDVTMREALRDSLNVPAVKALHEVGLDSSEAFAEGLGIPVETMVESNALGANEVSSFEMAGAYGAFGNGGTYNDPHTVRAVEFPDGQVIDLAPEGTQAMEDYTAFMVSDMLKDVMTDGTAARLQMNGFEAAGKTGSSNFDEGDRERYGIPEGANAIPDAWFVGYSTELTASVWTGYPSSNDGYIDRNNNEHHISQDIFQEVMNYAHEGRETAGFRQPDSVVEVDIERATGLLPSSFTPDSEIISEYFVRGTEPGSVSEEFEMEEASGISGLSASYNESSNTIEASWSFPEDELEFFSFRIEVSDSESDFSTVDTTKNTSFSFSNPAPGETYTIRITPVDDEDDSEAGDAATAEVTVPEEEDEEEEENNEANNDENNNENNMNENNETNEENDSNENNETNENNEAPDESVEENNSAGNDNNAAPENNTTENEPETNNGNEEPQSNEETPAENSNSDNGPPEDTPGEGDPGDGNEEEVSSQEANEPDSTESEDE